MSPTDYAARTSTNPQLKRVEIKKGTPRLLNAAVALFAESCLQWQRDRPATVLVAFHCHLAPKKLTHLEVISPIMRLLSGFLKASLRVKIAPLMVPGRAICINHCRGEAVVNASGALFGPTADVEMRGYSGEARLMMTRGPE